MKDCRRLGLLVLLYPLYGCVPGLWPLGGFGMASLRTVRPDGQPIAGASVGVVQLPKGGAVELERRVRAHEPLDGWMATTDKRGKAHIADEVETASKRAQYPQPARYVFSETSHRYERDEAAGGEAKPERLPLDLDDSVGLVVIAKGYEPFIGTARLGRKGLVPKLRLTTLAGREPSQKRETATVTLDPTPRIVATATDEARSGIPPHSGD